MSPCTGHKLSHWRVQSRLFLLIFSWWCIPELWVGFFFLWWTTRNPHCSQICDQPSGIWHVLLCYYFCLWFDHFATAKQEKARGACVFFFEEEETAALQDTMFKSRWSSACSKSMTKQSNNWQWNLNHYYNIYLNIISLILCLALFIPHQALSKGVKV